MRKLFELRAGRVPRIYGSEGEQGCRGDSPWWNPAAVRIYLSFFLVLKSGQFGAIPGALCYVIFLEKKSDIWSRNPRR